MSSRRPLNFRAFPSVDPDGETYLGMTLRDYFAAKALAHPYTALQHDGTEPSPAQVAEWAYDIADAMLAEREDYE